MKYTNTWINDSLEHTSFQLGDVTRGRLDAQSLGFLHAKFHESLLVWCIDGEKYQVSRVEATINGGEIIDLNQDIIPQPQRWRRRGSQELMKQSWTILRQRRWKIRHYSTSSHHYCLLVYRVSVSISKI